MANFTTVFGENVDLNIVQIKTSSYKFVVEKRVNGQFRTSYPVKSMGEAKVLIQKIQA